MVKINNKIVGYTIAGINGASISTFAGSCNGVKELDKEGFKKKLEEYGELNNNADINAIFTAVTGLDDSTDDVVRTIKGAITKYKKAGEFTLWKGSDTSKINFMEGCDKKKIPSGTKGAKVTITAPAKEGGDEYTVTAEIVTGETNETKTTE